MPPECFRPVGLHANDPDKANQYRLGIIGYEMLVWRERFSTEARRRAAMLKGGRYSRLTLPRIDDTVRGGCPSFLSEAIARMIAPHHIHRFPSLVEALAAIAHRDLDVEMARDSFRRIVSNEQVEVRFFRAFYSRLLNSSRGIARVFQQKQFPVLC